MKFLSILFLVLISICVSCESNENKESTTDDDPSVENKTELIESGHPHYEIFKDGRAYKVSHNVFNFDVTFPGIPEYQTFENMPNGINEFVLKYFESSSMSIWEVIIKEYTDQAEVWDYDSYLEFLHVQENQMSLKAEEIEIENTNGIKITKNDSALCYYEVMFLRDRTRFQILRSFTDLEQFEKNATHFDHFVNSFKFADKQ